MLRQYAKKLLWGGAFFLIGYILNTFLYPLIIAIFSIFMGTETLWINLVPAWPAIFFWIAAYTLRTNRSEERRAYLGTLGDSCPTRKETLRFVIHRRELVADFLAFLTVLFVYLMGIIAQTQSFWLCMFFFWIYTPVYLLTDVLSWYLVHRHWQKDKY